MRHTYDVTWLFYVGLLIWVMIWIWVTFFAYALLKITVHLFGGPVYREIADGTLRWGRTTKRQRPLPADASEPAQEGSSEAKQSGFPGSELK